MNYNFDEIIDRSGSHCVKIEKMFDIWGRSDLLPLWVADMDFKTPPFIIDTIQKRLQHPVLGYSCPHHGYYASIINWVWKRYGMEVQKEQIHFVPGIVPGIYMVVNALTEKGDKIVIQQPVYHPFKQVVESSGRICVNNPLQLTDKRYQMDFDHLRNVIKGCKLFILCNPHNPGGTVWGQKDMEMLAEICSQYGVTVISDEIHADLTLPPHRHIPFALSGETAKQLSITLMSPSKVFNMPGLVASHAIVFNNQLRGKLFNYIAYNGLDLGSVFSYLAVETAYTQGEEWLEQLMDYLQDNIAFVENWLHTKMPAIKIIPPQASFLLFVDCRGLGFSSQRELDDLFVQKAKLALNSGTLFGSEGEGFMRLNIATPRTILEKAMNQLKEAHRALGFH